MRVFPRPFVLPQRAPPKQYFKQQWFNGLERLFTQFLCVSATRTTDATPAVPTFYTPIDAVWAKH